jgi:isopentenyl-diphosphate delta-isomerase
MEHVVLVDNNDNPIGTMEKLEAHQKAVLHRAFSILLFNSKGELLLQKRAAGKYHSGLLWTNTCCSHPLPDESMEQATKRKLLQEMGIEVELEFAYKFIYKAELDKNLIEHEYDYVFIGQYDGDPTINPDEVDDWKYINLIKLKEDIRDNPDQYTAWFKLIMQHPEMTAITI